MTDLISTIFINGEKTTFLNYISPLIGGEPWASGSATWLDSMLTAQFGDTRNIWTKSTTSGVYNIRFPASFETRTGNVADVNLGNIGAGMRAQISVAQLINCISANSNGSNDRCQIGSSFGGFGGNQYTFAVINNYAFAYVSFNASDRSGDRAFKYTGWAKSGQYPSFLYPRNFTGVARSDSVFIAGRIGTENSFDNPAYFMQTQPVISCQIPTTGANASDIILQDGNSPNYYIGKLWHCIRLPSSCVNGKIYKNTGVDPDTGIIETDQKAFWMCVGSWGTDKIGMRVWTDNIT
jgi:hypothetical protein